VVYGSLGGTGRAVVTAFDYNDHNNSRKRYLFIYLFIYMIYFTVQIHREHNLLALNLGLKYEIQVPNIGDMHWGPQPSYWEFRPPIAPP